MNTTIENISDVRKSIAAVFGKDEVVAEENAVQNDFIKHAQIPGFRPGKAPLSLIKQRFTKEISDDTNQRLVKKAYKHITEESDLKIFALVDVKEVTKQEDSGEVHATFVVDLIPEFTLPEYISIPVNAFTDAVTEEELDSEIERIRKQAATMEVADVPAGVGDFVRLSYVGKIGEELIENIAPDSPLYGTQKNTWEKAGDLENMGVKAIVEGVVGMKAGDTKTVTMKFEDDFEIEALAGKEATYDLEATEVRVQKLPELDKDFFKAHEVASLEELRKQSEQSIQQQKELDGRNKQREQIAKYLDSNAEFAIPESAVEQEVEVILKEHLEMLQRRGFPMDHIEEYKEKLIADAEKVARENVKIRFILFEIAQKEKIEIQKEDLWSKVAQQAYMQGVSTDQVVKKLQSDQAFVDELRNQILVGKTLDFLSEKALIKSEKDPVEEESKA